MRSCSQGVAAAAAAGLRPGLRRAANTARTPDAVRNTIVALVDEQRSGTSNNACCRQAIHDASNPRLVITSP